MTLGLALILFGALLVYAGVKGLSVRRLAVGDNSTQAQAQQVTQ